MFKLSKAIFLFCFSYFKTRTDDKIPIPNITKETRENIAEVLYISIKYPFTWVPTAAPKNRLSDTKDITVPFIFGNFSCAVATNVE